MNALIQKLLRHKKQKSKHISVIIFWSKRVVFIWRFVCFIINLQKWPLITRLERMLMCIMFNIQKTKKSYETDITCLRSIPYRTQRSHIKKNSSYIWRSHRMIWTIFTGYLLCSVLSLLLSSGTFSPETETEKKIQYACLWIFGKLDEIRMLCIQDNKSFISVIWGSQESAN